LASSTAGVEERQGPLPELAETGEDLFEVLGGGKARAESKEGPVVLFADLELEPGSAQAVLGVTLPERDRDGVREEARVGERQA